MNPPRSPHDTQGGLVFFPRMLDKIRMQARGELPAGYHANFGQGMDARTCGFLGVCHEDVVEQVERGLSDAEVLDWCYANGRHPTDLDIDLFNGFMTKRGWRDPEEVTAALQGFKQSCQLTDRDDVLTFFDLFEVDEGRKP